MRFDWDEAKRCTNIEKHGVDFLDAALIFEGKTLSRVDTRFDYGEEREIALGVADGKFYCVVFTRREGAIRRISAWKGGIKDYERYKTSIP